MATLKACIKVSLYTVYVPALKELTVVYVKCFERPDLI